jgi:hypothetical protein
MCALHPGQFVEVAASLTSCLRLHSKQATTRLRFPPHKPSSFRNPAASGGGVGAAAVSLVRTAATGFGCDGEKLRPHCRHMVDFAAA